MKYYKLKKFYLRHYNAFNLMISFLVAVAFDNIFADGYVKYGFYSFVPLRVSMFLPLIMIYVHRKWFRKNHRLYNKLVHEELGHVALKAQIMPYTAMWSVVCVVYIICTAVFVKNHPEFVQAYPWLFGLK